MTAPAPCACACPLCRSLTGNLRIPGSALFFRRLVFQARLLRAHRDFAKAASQLKSCGNAKAEMLVTRELNRLRLPRQTWSLEYMRRVAASVHCDDLRHHLFTHARGAESVILQANSNDPNARVIEVVIDPELPHEAQVFEGLVDPDTGMRLPSTRDNPRAVANVGGLNDLGLRRRSDDLSGTRQRKKRRQPWTTFDRDVLLWFLNRYDGVPQDRLADRLESDWTNFSVRSPRGNKEGRARLLTRESVNAAIRRVEQRAAPPP